MKKKISGTFKALGHNLTRESPLLITILLRKIDVKLNKTFDNRRTTHEPSTADDLMQYMEN